MPKTAFAAQRRAVGLVIRAFEDELRTMGCANLGHLACDHLRVVCAFQLAGASNHQKRVVIADRKVTDIYIMHHELTCSRRIEAVIETIR